MPKEDVPADYVSQPPRQFDFDNLVSLRPDQFIFCNSLTPVLHFLLSSLSMLSQHSLIMCGMVSMEASNHVTKNNIESTYRLSWKDHLPRAVSLALLSVRYNAMPLGPISRYLYLLGMESEPNGRIRL